MVERVQVPWVVLGRWTLFGFSAVWAAGMVTFGTANSDGGTGVVLAVWALLLLGPPFATQNRRWFPAVCVAAVLTCLVGGVIFAMAGLWVFWPLAVPLLVMAVLPPGSASGLTVAARRPDPERLVSRVSWLAKAVAVAVPAGLIVTVLVIWAYGSAA